MFGPDVQTTTAPGVLLLGQEQVVLAEDAGGHPPEHQPELRPRGPAPVAPAKGPWRPPVSSFSSTGSSRRRNDDTLACTQPARSTTTATAFPVAGSEPGRLDDQALGPGGGLGEVSLELGHGGAVERPGPRGAQ